MIRFSPVIAIIYIIIVSLMIIVLEFAYKYMLVNISIQYLELIFGSYVLPSKNLASVRFI